MKEIKLSILLLLATMLLTQAYSGGMQEGIDIHRLEGVVRRIGSEPFTELVLTTDDGKDYVITRNSYSRFEPYLQKQIIVEAGIQSEKIKTADGKYTITKYVLVNPLILP